MKSICNGCDQRKTCPCLEQNLKSFPDCVETFHITDYTENRLRELLCQEIRSTQKYCDANGENLCPGLIGVDCRCERCGCDTKEESQGG